MQIGNKAPCGQNNAYFTLKIACLIVMITNKKNLKERISKKGKYHYFKTELYDQQQKSWC